MMSSLRVLSPSIVDYTCVSFIWHRLYCYRKRELACTERRERNEPLVGAAAAHAATHSCRGAVDKKEESASTSGSMIIPPQGCVVSAIIFFKNGDANREGV